ncbi:MAG: septation regulator SpoVG [Lachnospiraceae bacterium]|nr:septation regulator SpoVG [Lachnospiraceae bacterium]
MEITDVRIRKIEQTEGKLRGIASITIDDAFVIHDIKVIQGDRGLFIAMPSRKTSEGDYRDIAHPITTQARDKVQTVILNAYEKADQDYA